MNDGKLERRPDWTGVFRSVKNRMFFPQPPWMDSRRSGKYLANSASVHEKADWQRNANASPASTRNTGNAVSEFRRERREQLPPEHIVHIVGVRGAARDDFRVE